MALVNLLPRTINTTGASCTGSDGDTDRTYTLPDSGVISSGLDINVSGTTLHEGAANDFTRSDNVITFKNALWDDSVIRINYYITFGSSAASGLSTTTSLKYCTPLMLANALGIVKDVPSWDTSGTPTYEEVGTGDNSETTFYLDQKSIIADTYTIYYGSDQDNMTALTETTHYSIDNDTGRITLTADGVTAVGTDNIYAEYKYYDNGMKDSYIQQVLARSEQEIDSVLNTTFTDGTQTNPDYPLEIEIQSSEGYYHNRIIVKNLPIINITSELDGAITSTDTTISLASAQGGEQFPEEGYIIVGSEIITYTGVDGDDLTGCSRGVLGTTAATHANGDEVNSTILFRSGTSEGTTVSWTVQPWHTSMYAYDDGMIYYFKDSDPDFLYRTGVAERIKIIYLYGHDSVPSDITRLTILLAKKQLVGDTISKALIAGRNEFNPEMVNADSEEIQRIIEQYKIYSMLNV